MKLAGVLTVALLATSGVALAVTAAPPGVEVEGAWIRWLPANLPVAGYVTIENRGAAAIAVTGASSPTFRNVSLMESRLAEDDSSMVPVARIDVPAHGSAKLAPGGYHIMLSHATHPIKPGDHVPITLHFADGAALQVDFSVLPANASGPAN